MLPTFHVLYGLVFSALLYFLNIPLVSILIIFAASILIDFDHYLFYIALKKNLNPFKSVKWYFTEGKKYENNKKYQFAFMQVFHTIEFLIILSILSFFSTIALLILIGCFFHISCDIAHHIITGHFYLKSPSLFYRKGVKI